MLKNLSQLLSKAQAQYYAVPAFNVFNLESLQAVVNASQRLRAPIILAASEGAIEYASLSLLAPLMLNAARQAQTPIAVHLDHGASLKTVKSCLEAGFTSIMFDGSHLKLKENTRLTRQAAAIAHKRGASCEGELGTIGGEEENISSHKIVLTEPSEAKQFAEETGVDALAIAIGTSHGAYKFVGKPRLDFKRLAEIRNAIAAIKTPLVLHGGSSIPQALVRQANSFGAKLVHTHGVPEAQIRKAVSLGICKVNENTDLRLAFTAAIRKMLAQNPKEFESHKILAPARELMQKVAEHRIRLLGSAGKT